jgi:CelD/BcsL family acetyltransferase involved in cellulose biosynthesis
VAAAVIALSDEPGFDFGSAEYRAFFARFGLTPFQHPDWLGPFYRRLPEAAERTPLILVGRRRGELCCVLPLLRSAEGDVSFAFLGVTDYACPVLDPEVAEELAVGAALREIVGAYRLHIAPVHAEHRGLWRTLLGRDGAPMHYGAHAVSIRRPIAEGRQETYGRNMLVGLGRKGRRLADLGNLQLTQLGGAEARKAMEMAARFRVGRFPDDPLQVPASAAFYGDVAASGGGLARTYRLSLDGDVVALMFGLAHRERFHYVVLACNYPGYARYSPGLTILDMAIEAWADEGGTVFDFTIGDEAFKAAFGCRRTPIYAITN